MKHFFILSILVYSFSSFCQQRENQQNDQLFYPKEQEGKWFFSNLIDTINQTNSLYDTIHFCTYGYDPTYFIAVKNQNFDLFDSQLKRITTGKIADYLCTENNLFIKWQKEWTRYQFSENKLSYFQADSISTTNDLTYVFHQNKTGLIKENTFIPPTYYRLIPFEDHKQNYPTPLFLTLDKGKYGLIDQTGKTIIESIASIIQHEEFGILKYKEGNWKYLFPDGKIVDPLGCEIHIYSNKHYKIYDKKRSKGTFYVNHKILENIQMYDDIFPLNNSNYFAVKQNNKIGLLNTSFKLIIHPFCDQIEMIEAVRIGNSNEYNDSKLLKYLIGEKWGIMDYNGTKIIEAKYDNILEIQKTENGLLFKIAMNEKVGLIDKQERVIIPIEYDNFGRFGNGYVVQNNKKIGYLDLHAKEVLKLEYNSFHSDFWKFGLDYKDHIIAFVKGNTYTLINWNAQQILPIPCIDYEYSNNIIKCYYKDRIEVHVMENGNSIELTTYPNIQSVNFYKEIKHSGTLGGYPETRLELNQLTGLYGARYELKAGLGLSPTYTHRQKTMFSDWFEAGVIEDSTIIFTQNSFPTLTAYDLFNWMNCSGGRFHSSIILGTEIFNSSGSNRDSDDSYILYKNNPIQWLTSSNKDKVDKNIEAYGLLYNKQINSNFQEVYIGGEIKIVSIREADLSLIDYFNYLNAGENLWFADLEQAKKIMNPNLGVKFINGKVALRDTRDHNRIGFNYDIDEFIGSNQWNYVRYKKTGQNTWTICNDLDFKKAPIDNLLSIQCSESQYKEFIIIEKQIDNQTKKGIYSTNLKPITEVIYDNIIYAGSLGFLVQKDGAYFYINESGEKIPSN